MQTNPRHLILFDIDGTLLLCGGAGGRAMARAGRELFGESFDWSGIQPAGALDPHLFRQAAVQSGLPAGEHEHGAFRRKYLEVLLDELERSRDRIRIMPGIRDVLEVLQQLDHVALGLLTGNYGHSARMKLSAAGIDAEHFRFCAFGDEAETRPGLVPVAWSKFATAYDGCPSPPRTVVVGDTPRDVECALANDCIAFAVATGSCSRDELIAAGAHVAVEDLSDPRPLLDLLDADLRETHS